MIALLSTAFAAPVALALGVAGSGEAVMQGGLVAAYPQLGKSLSAEVLASAKLPAPVEITLEVGYRRLSGTTTSGDASWIWYVPVSGVVSGRLDVGSVSLLGGLGPSMVTWQEQASGADVPGRKDWGLRWGVLLETSARYHTPWLSSPSLDPARRGGGLDLFVSAGARFSDVADAATACSASECGFDWSAFRLSGGVLLRL